MAIRIHHATAKRAEAAGIALSLVEQNGETAGVRAEKGKSVVFHTDAKFAAAWAEIAEALRLEYPALQVVSTDTDGDENHLPFECYVFHGPEGRHVDFDEMDGDEIPTLARVLELAEEQGLDPQAEVEEATEEDEPETRGNVVPEKYKERYKERGNPDHCGDWLATYMEGRFDDAEGIFQPYAFETFLRENDVPFEGKWTGLPESGQRGWQGRFRMNGRQILEKYVALHGEVRHDGQTTQPPADYLADLRTKHAKWLKKQAPEAATETKAGEEQGA